MSLPLVAPPQRLSPDDVLAVEIIDDSDTCMQDIREHFGVEHFAGSSSQDARHRVVTVPVAIATLVIDRPHTWTAGRFKVTFEHGFSEAPAFNILGQIIPSFRFRVPEPWYGVAFTARTSNGFFATGWSRFQNPSEPSRGGVVWTGATTTQVGDIEGCCIAVFGDK